MKFRVASLLSLSKTVLKISNKVICLAMIMISYNLVDNYNTNVNVWR